MFVREVLKNHLPEKLLFHRTALYSWVFRISINIIFRICLWLQHQFLLVKVAPVPVLKHTTVSWIVKVSGVTELLGITFVMVSCETSHLPPFKKVLQRERSFQILNKYPFILIIPYVVSPYNVASSRNHFYFKALKLLNLLIHFKLRLIFMGLMDDINKQHTIICSDCPHCCLSPSPTITADISAHNDLYLHQYSPAVGFFSWLYCHVALLKQPNLLGQRHSAKSTAGCLEDR